MLQGLKTAKFVLISALCILSSALAAFAAKPSFTVGSVTGTAGSAVTLPVSYNPSTYSVAGIQFNLNVSSKLSTGTVTPGAVVTQAGKSVSTLLSGTTWTFIIFGLNQTAISSGTLLSAQLWISAAAPAGNISIPVTGLIYTDPNGKTIPVGSVIGGTLTVIASTSSVPTLTSISPSSATAGGAAFTLTVNGSNFISSSTVQWNGSSRSTSYVSATKLTAAIKASDIVTAGTATVTVVNPAPGGGTSNALSFTINGSGGNPVPTLASISPSSATAGGAAFTLTVTGTQFVNGSFVRWNGVNQTTTFVSPTRLTASIPASHIVSSGTANIRVFNPAPGGGVSNMQVFTIAATNGPIQPESLMVTTNLSGIRVYPNPWRSDKHAGRSITFDNLMANTKVQIFTVSGHQVKSLPISSTTVTWDLTNDSGDKVASGLYVYLMTTDSRQKKTGQLAILK